MKDPIERQMAIDALHVWFNINMVTEKDMSDHIHDLELIINHIIGLQKVALRKLPPAQPEQRWIPCSERLPENSNFYIVTRKDFLVGCMWYSVMHGWEWKEKEQPVAWMPLPEPWKGEQHG